jgi:alpha-galactosidase
MEMANPDARLVTEHPDWLLTEPNRPRHLQRGQYVLDLVNPEVQDFCIRSFNKILSDYPDISFVKWDCNSPFHNPYSHYLGKNQQHLWYEYTLGLYRVFAQCVQANPRLQMMLCSAGGARCDYGAMRFFHEFWTSDNTTPLKRVFIQWGASHVFPSKIHGAHVTHMGRQPFKFAFDVAMSGCLGMDADPTKMTGEEKKITLRALDVYKNRLRPVVQLGDLYRLVSPYENSRSVVSYVDETQDRAVVFVYQVNDDKEGIKVLLQGLNPEKSYRLEEVNIDSPKVAACRENGKMLSGKELMEAGIYFDCKKRFDSASLYLY